MSPTPVAYLVNQYPKTAHTFIRREIRAVEAQGIRVLRITVRRSVDVLVDPQDHLEDSHTRVILEQGVLRLLLAVVSMVLRAPLGFLRALGDMLHLILRGRWVAPAYVVEACQCAIWFRNEGVTHLHAHFGTNSASVALMVHRLTGIPYSFTVHGPAEFDNVEMLALRRKIAAAAFVVAVSQNGRAGLLRLCSMDRFDRIKLIHCGLDEDYFQQEPPALSGSRVMLFVGRFEEQKGIPFLIDALELLKPDQRPDELIMVGDGPLRPVIEQRVRDRGLSEVVTFRGWQTAEAIRALIAHCDVFVLPSLAEGLPVVLMEAMALGRPVIATQVGGITELVVDGRMGWIVPPADVPALAGAMDAALNSPLDVLREMGRSGMIRVAEQHDVRQAGEQLAALFRAGSD